MSIRNEYRLLKRCYYAMFFLLYFISVSAYSQETSSKLSTQTLERFENAKKLLLTNDYFAYEKGNNLLIGLENELIAKNDYRQLEELYLEISAFYLTKYDYNSAKKLLDKLSNVLQKHPDNVIKGSYYEHLSIYYNVQDSLALEEKYTLLSEYYFTKYSSKTNQVDMYYNLAYSLYKKRELA